MREQVAWRIYLPPYAPLLMVPSGVVNSPTLLKCTCVPAEELFTALEKARDQGLGLMWNSGANVGDCYLSANNVAGIIQVLKSQFYLIHSMRNIQTSSPLYRWINWSTHWLTHSQYHTTTKWLNQSFTTSSLTLDLALSETKQTFRTV